MYFIKKIIPGLLLLMTLGFYPLPAQSKAIKIKMDDGKALVTLLQGSASVFKKGVAKPKALSQGDLLSQGDRVTTNAKSRIEIKMPDKSVVRFDEKTTFVLESIAYDKKAKTKTSIAGVRGTDFRMNVNKDNSAVLKVYAGEVAVSKRKDTEIAKTKPIPAKPTPVAGPHPVSMEEWTYIVRSLQQINIRPDGTAAKPFRFDIAADLNDWVRWNQTRNKLLLRQGR